jgi:predicted metal-dependent peptidase
MSAAHLERAAAELGRIIRLSGVAARGVRVLCCDTTAHEVARVFDARSVRLVGGGGTDLRAGIAAAAALHPHPDVVVVLTDGWTDWPERPPPRTTVVVGLLGGEVPSPEWARTVDIPLDEADDERNEGAGVEVDTDVVDRT